MFYHVNRSEIKVPVPIKEAQLQLLGFRVFTQTRPACVGVPRKSVWRIWDVYPGKPAPDFYPSRILDLGSRIQKQQQKRGVKKNLMSYLSM
jgi:hypothetical protein